MSSATRPQLQYLHDAIEDLKAKHLYFKLKILEGEQKPVANFDGKEVINLSSNNYLGLTTHPKLRRAAIDATRKFGVGSGAVRTIAGTMKMHMDLEEQIAQIQKSGSVRGIPIRIHGQCRHRLRDPRQRRSGHLRRAESRLDH